MALNTFGEIVIDTLKNSRYMNLNYLKTNPYKIPTLQTCCIKTSNKWCSSDLHTPYIQVTILNSFCVDLNFGENHNYINKTNKSANPYKELVFTLVRMHFYQFLSHTFSTELSK